MNMYVSLKELNRLYQKMSAKADATQTSLFRVRTGLKCGSNGSFKLSDEYDDCWQKLNPICTKWCHDSGMTQAELSIDCSCYP